MTQDLGPGDRIIHKTFGSRGTFIGMHEDEGRAVVPLDEGGPQNVFVGAVRHITPDDLAPDERFEVGQRVTAWDSREDRGMVLGVNGDKVVILRDTGATVLEDAWQLIPLPAG